MSTVTEAEEFGDALQHLREEHGWTRPELVQRLREVDPGYGWSVQRLTHLERGNVRHPPLRHLRLLSIVLGCEIRDLVWPDPRPNSHTGWTTYYRRYQQRVAVA